VAASTKQGTFSLAFRICMRRRCIKIVLIVAYLAGQLAGMPHAHSADGTAHVADHSRPHVHLSWVDHMRHVHDHEHHDHDHDHGHEDAPDEHSHGQHPEPSSGQNQDHNSDAVYLPDGAGAPSVVPSAVNASDACLPATTLLVMCTCMPAAPSESSPDDLFPGECSFGCPLYLALRALRL
jgi:hypothetical protein